MSFHVPAYLSGKPKGESGIGNSAADLSLGYPPAIEKRDGAFAWYEQKTHTDYAFGIVTYKTDNLIYYTLVTTDDDRDYVAFGKNLLEKAEKIGYNVLLPITNANGESISVSRS